MQESDGHDNWVCYCFKRAPRSPRWKLSEVCYCFKRAPGSRPQVKVKWGLLLFQKSSQEPQVKFPGKETTQKLCTVLHIISFTIDTEHIKLDNVMCLCWLTSSMLLLEPRKMYIIMLQAHWKFKWNIGMNWWKKYGNKVGIARLTTCMSHATSGHKPHLHTYPYMWCIIYIESVWVHLQC